MITKKVLPGMERKLLMGLYRRYIDQFGHGIRHLQEYKILITAAEVYLPEMPELREVQGNMARDLFIDVMKELEASGFVVFDGSTAFNLTESGYRKASMSWKDRTLDFFNKNEGLAVPISVISLVVAVIALFT